MRVGGITFLHNLVVVGSLSNHDDDGDKNVMKNSRFARAFSHFCTFHCRSHNFQKAPKQSPLQIAKNVAQIIAEIPVHR